MCQRFGPGVGRGVGVVRVLGMGSVSKVSSHPYVCAVQSSGTLWSVHILEPEFDILATYLSCVKHFSDRERRKVALFPGTVHFLLSK